MENFKYEPINLERPSLRLLRLLKGEEPDNVECELFQAYLDGDDLIPYHALSYTWGGTEMSSAVIVNGRRLGVTENLELALQYLRSREMDRILWVDAICIDQGNKSERGHQVQQMGNIYSQAEEVIVWLGPATYATNVLMDSLTKLKDKSLGSACRNWNPADIRWNNLWRSVQPSLMDEYTSLTTLQHRGLELLLSRPWFKRVWILQEVVNAKRAVVQSGKRSIPAYIFALAPLLLQTRPEDHSQAVLDIMPGPVRKNSWWSEKRNLYTLLQKFSKSEASDPRDRVYALLGISSDAFDARSLRPDYNKNIQHVINNTAAFLFGSSTVSRAIV
ncbi:HET-domain-containing protein [Lindgomyces ingoldianus]|uniref:HET-domain-containing protein n=1 Tax=Lindgomyces ingoldianus TaxID=673940 RepID=A0ACB6QA89_9PLEO|nr:HET-domain-containing protein [Lindgomyces ingoldianus]KAF2463949.1 HET-domain-containing protein [Lindgomyces ingoldianus]